MTDPLLASWKDRAECRKEPITPGADPFYPEGHQNSRTWLPAMQICARCPVKDECLKDAIDRRDAQGFRAGFTPDQLRSRLRSMRVTIPDRVPGKTNNANDARRAQGEANRNAIAELASSGMTSIEIAAELGLSKVTVHHHLRDLRERNVIAPDAGIVRGEEIPCGTSRGYRKHRRRKEKICDECRAAETARLRAIRARAREEAAS